MGSGGQRVPPKKASPRVKGVNFRSTVMAYRELRGEDALKRAFGLMSPEVSAALQNGTIVTGGWYPIEWYANAYRAYLAASGDGAPLAQRMGYLSTKMDMAKLHHRLISTFVSPQILFKFATGFFNTYYDTGTFSVIESTRGYVKAHIVGAACFDRNIWFDTVGSSVALLEAAGGKEVRIHVISGGGDGDDSLEYEAFWT